MAIDEAVLETSIRRRRTMPIVRFYTWTSPALSVGANTELADDLTARCRANGLEVVRRPTGGGAVLHRGDLTYCVVAPLPSAQISVLDLYRWVAEGLVTGFRLLGLDATVMTHSGPARSLACFAQPTGADLSVGGRKVCGSAQVRRRGWFLQHGSIPIKDVRAEAAALFGMDLDDSTFLHALLPGASYGILAETLARGFSSFWGAAPVGRRLSEEEAAAVAEKVLPNPLVSV